MTKEEKLKEFKAQIKKIITLNNKILKSYFDFDINEEGKLTNITVTDNYEEIQILTLCLGSLVGEYELLTSIVNDIAKELSIPKSEQTAFKSGLMKTCLQILDAVVTICQEKVNLLKEEK